MRKGFVREIGYTAIFFLVLLPCLAFAQPQLQETPEQVGEELSISDIAQELGLSANQKEQLSEQRFQEQYTRMETRNKIRLKELQLRHELEKDAINKESVDKIVAELKELQGDTIEQRVNSILKLKEILTPEQFEKLQSRGRWRMQQGKQEGVQGLRKRFRDLKNR